MWNADDESGGRAVPFLSGLVFGLAIGAGVALLFAPVQGKRARARLQRAAGNLKATATHRWEDVADDVRNRVEEVLDGARKHIG